MEQRGSVATALASVTEKGDLCDETYSADARRTRAPQLCRTTIRSYLQTMEEFRRFADKRLDHLGADAFLLRENTQAPGHEGGSSLSECLTAYAHAAYDS